LKSDDLDEKRRQRLIEKKAKIDEKLQELMDVKQEEPEKESLKEEAPQLTSQQPLSPAPKAEVVVVDKAEEKPQEKVEEKLDEKKPNLEEGTEKAEDKSLADLVDSRSLYKTALREASQKYLSLRKELKEEHHRIQKLRQVVRALKILSKAGIATECRVTVAPEQSAFAEEDLALAKQRIVDKKAAAREQARAVRELIRSHKKEERKTGPKRPRRERREKEGEEKRVRNRRPHQKKTPKDRKEEKEKHPHKKERKQLKAKKVRYERKTRQVKRYRKDSL